MFFPNEMWLLWLYIFLWIDIYCKYQADLVEFGFERELLWFLKYFLLSLNLLFLLFLSLIFHTFIIKHFPPIFPILKISIFLILFFGGTFGLWLFFCGIGVDVYLFDWAVVLGEMGMYLLLEVWDIVVWQVMFERKWIGQDKLIIIFFNL